MAITLFSFFPILVLLSMSKILETESILTGLEYPETIYEFNDSYEQIILHFFLFYLKFVISVFFWFDEKLS